MSWVAGVDGCRAGWVVVLLQCKGRRYETHIRLCRDFAEVLALNPQPAVIAIDVPIGLLDKPQPGGRECDQQARKLLGRRASSIFSPPTRPMLKATRYEQVRTQGLSIQSFNILPKIREVDQLMTPGLQPRVHEAHPELAFMSLAGAPMQYNKKTQEGREERTRALERLLQWKGTPLWLPFRRAATSHRDFLRSQGRPYKKKGATYIPHSHIAPDDILDAYILAWTALCISTGQAHRVPVNPLVDRKRLKMEIWF